MAVDLLDHFEGPFRFRVVATERTDGDMHPSRVHREVLQARQIACGRRRRDRLGTGWATRCYLGS